MPLTALAAVAMVALLPAGSAHADGCVNAQYRTGASAGLPDCRAYEQVSPRQKFGNSVWVAPTQVITSASGTGVRVPGWSAPSGDRVLFNPQGVATSENVLRGYQFPQVSERIDGERWEVRPAIAGPPNDRVLTAANALPRLQIPSADRSALLFGGIMPFSPLQPDIVSFDAHGGVHLAAHGAVDWLTRPRWAGVDPAPGTPGLSGEKFAPIGVSDDLSTAYFMTRQVLTPEDVVSGRSWDQAWALYKVKDGVLSNAGVLPGGGGVDAAGSVSAGLEPTAGQVNAANNNNFSSTLGSVRVVSPDGERALFLSTGNRSTPSPQLYLHRDGQESLLISKSPASPNVPASGASGGVVPIWAYNAAQTNPHNSSSAGNAFATGDRDLGVVVFATRDALLPGNPGDGTHVNTYRYVVGTNTLQYLADLDRPGSAASRAQTGNVYRVSDDATRILFRTPAGELKLWRHGQSTVTLMTGLETTGDTSTRGARFSDDGKTVVFMSTRASTGAVPGDPDHPGGGGFVQTQVYRYEEGVDTAARCISCPPASATTKGPASFDLFSPISTGYGVMNNNYTGAAQSRGISTDGRRVFFTTTSTLDSRDGNDTADVYEWSADRGDAALISSGAADSRGEGLLDVDATGDNVFFVSAQQLTASDTDEISDLYVARIGGGLPDPPAFDRESSCALGGCQGPASAPPVLSNIGTVSFGGDGNVPLVPDPVRASVGVSKLRAVSGSAAKLKVRVPDSGRISVAGSSIRRTGKSATKAGTYSVKISLSSKAKKSLKKKKKLKVSARVSFRAKDGQSASKTITVTFKQPKSKRAKAKKGGR